MNKSEKFLLIAVLSWMLWAVKDIVFRDFSFSGIGVDVVFFASFGLWFVFAG
jgi:hypothetical protein